MATTQSLDPLSALVNIISTQTAILQTAYAKNNTKFPSIDDSFQPGPLDFDPSLTPARNLIVAAATQLIATVDSPMGFVYSKIGGLYDTVTLGFVVDVDIPDILNEAGPEGLHVDKLSEVTGVDASYIARVMRYLATSHIFKELSPDVFAHNRLSSHLTKAKSFKEIKADLCFMSCISSSCSHVSSITRSEELLKLSTAFIPFLKNSKQASAPFNMVYNTPEKMWEWTEKPGNELVSRKFTATMQNIGEMSPPEVFTNGIEADMLKSNAIVVDVGGGTGTAIFTIKKAFPNLRYIVQDLDKQIVAAKKFWDENDPEAIKSGQVQLQAHNFLHPQPIKGASVYFLRMVIHNWPDVEAQKILSSIRSAVDFNTESKLVIFEMLVKHVSEATNDLGSGSGEGAVPYPLLPNLGVAGAGLITSLDMSMLTMYNGKERTLAEYAQLGKESGWKLVDVKAGELAAFVYTPM
ncbi:S-adenosyl-L-methionine-dependent methyltransferase [Lentinula aciculospora]|uniref:S-adenosyl-L-methionine-dependent methyltransferase n=1 Tax=Lentinula aciculospora TaxID=153920 RepID=A0A9W8ZTC5_9AGAR|nr:S-adenosyl-L-methionine-dependent methyltransferase [Lentinula aciculospora]